MKVTRLLLWALGSALAVACGGTTTTDASVDVPSTPCGANQCTASQVCVRQRTVGGAFLRPDDAGACPSGRHLEGDACVADFAYRCVARPSCAEATCGCLGASCPTAFECTQAAQGQVTCEQQAP